MRTVPLFISCLVVACVTVTACRREAPGTGDITKDVTVAEQPATGANAPAATAAATQPTALQLVTAGAAQPYLADSANGRCISSKATRTAANAPATARAHGHPCWPMKPCRPAAPTSSPT